MRTSPSADGGNALLRRKDVLAGVLFVAVGAACATTALGYGLGTVGSMGAGFFPFGLGIVAIALGLLAVGRGLQSGAAGSVDAAGARPLALILCGTTCFALLVERAGLVPAIVALVLFACAARVRRQPLEVLLIALVLSAFAAGLFLYAFGMPLRAFGA